MFVVINHPYYPQGLIKNLKQLLEDSFSHKIIFSGSAGPSV